MSPDCRLLFGFLAALGSRGYSRQGWDVDAVYAVGTGVSCWKPPRQEIRDQVKSCPDQTPLDPRSKDGLVPLHPLERSLIHPSGRSPPVGRLPRLQPPEGGVLGGVGAPTDRRAPVSEEFGLSMYGRQTMPLCTPTDLVDSVRFRSHPEPTAGRIATMCPVNEPSSLQ